MEIRAFMKNDLRCITQDGSVREAAQLMEAADCGVLPIVKDTASRRPVGVVTDRDIALRCVAQGRDAGSTKVSEIATPDLVTCDENCSVAEAFERMREQKVGRLLVTDSNGDLIGIVSMADLIARVPREIVAQLPGADEAVPRRKTAA